MGAVQKAVDLVFLIFQFALIARVFISWLPIGRDNKFVDLLYAVTEPVLGPIRNMLSRSSLMNNSAFSMFDFSPIVALLLLGFLRKFISVVLINF